MYHSTIISAREEALLQKPGLKAMYPKGLPKYSTADSRALAQQIQQTRDEETGQTIRALTAEESRFAAVTRLRVMYDAPYYLESFVWIDEEGHGIRSLYPLWKSQQFVLDRLAAVELKHAKDQHQDGLLINVLKVRQVGISTLGMGLVSQRIFTQPYIRAIAGSDTEEQARYLFRMVERIYDQLPFFLKPERSVPYSAGRELNLANKASIKTAWGKTTRGALQAEGGKKGNIERGRSQPLDEPVLTPFGWRPMGELHAGSVVIGSNGKPTRVLSVHPQGEEAVFRITFSDGSWTRCSGDHLWSVTTAARRWQGQAPLLRTTQALIDGGLAWNKPSGRMAKWFIPMTPPVPLPTRRYVIDPYTMGAILGDGSVRQANIQLSCVDLEIRARVASTLPPEVIVGAKTYGVNWYLRKRGTGKTNLFVEEIRRLGLAGKYSYEKHIPREYLQGSVDQRVALLQGLMDTDGTASYSESKISFYTTSKQLADDFQELVESLGGIARVSVKPIAKAHTRKNGQTVTGRRVCYVFSLCLPDGICPFYLPRKVAQLRPVEQRKYFPSRGIVSIEPDGVAETQCIRVAAPDALYVTRRHVVTHNTNSVVHISELATWDNPEQLDSSLLPGIPRSPQTLVLFESTAELAGDWWHRQWLATEEGHGRFANIFIPWCVKYEDRAPVDWAPNAETLKVAGQITRDSHKWVGETLHLTRDQLFWYEGMRSFYSSKNQLHDFFKEYPSNPEECFQYAGRSVFSHEDIGRIDQAARPLLDVWTVQPSRDIAELKRLPSEDQLAQKAADSRRFPPPSAPKLPRVAADLHPVPPGYGFRRLTKQEIQDLPSLRQSVMAIWEYPRSRGRRRYVISGDVGDGVVKDYSVATVVREPTIEEPAEEVAQFVSNTVKPSEFAFIIDAIGHFYCDEDGIEACAAIELNNHGITVQDLLQLHLGYSNFYVWEVVDAADASARFTKRIGWTTTTRTRPILLEKFHDAVTTRDPISGIADFRLNSPTTRAELRFFVTEGGLGEAEHAKGQHDDCLPADTWIRTRLGMKAIVDVQVGDEVLTHMGRYRPVIRIGSRYAATLYDFTVAGRNNIKLTNNHPLLAHRRQFRWTGQATTLCHHPAEWRRPDAEGDWRSFALTYPVPIDTIDRDVVALIEYAPATYNVINQQLIAFTYDGQRRNGHQNTLASDVVVNGDFCRLLGYYIAEGACGAHSLQWASHEREGAIRAWLIQYLEGLGLHPAERRVSAEGFRVSAGSVPLTAFFSTFGSGRGKTLPRWTESLPVEKQWEILTGYLLGDGCFRLKTGGISAVTVSINLAVQLYEMALRLGLSPVLRAQKNPLRWQADNWFLGFASADAQRIKAHIPTALLACKRPIAAARPQYSFTRLRQHEGRLLGKVERVEQVPHENLVYNLEVEEDNSYVANGTIVHNCIFSSAIGYYVAYRQSGGESEPLAERRRRRSQLVAQSQQSGVAKPDYRNSPVSAEAANAGDPDDVEDDLSISRDSAHDVFFDPRRHA